jgi:hypothetical protein
VAASEKKWLAAVAAVVAERGENREHEQKIPTLAEREREREK